jgi:hypothetical protein
LVEPTDTFFSFPIGLVNIHVVFISEP